GAIDYAIAPDPDWRNVSGARLVLLEIIGAHHDAIANRGAALNDTANADDAPLDVRVRDNAPVGDDRLTQSRPVDFAAGQKPRMRVNRRLGVKKTVFWNKVGQIEVRLVKRGWYRHLPNSLGK